MYNTPKREACTKHWQLHSESPSPNLKSTQARAGMWGATTRSNLIQRGWRRLCTRLGVMLDRELDRPTCAHTERTIAPDHLDSHIPRGAATWAAALAVSSSASAAR